MLLSVITFIIVLGLLVFAHEFGHFVTAKKTGMKVEEFGFGFPPRIWGFKKGETLYSINWIPLGGFVKIKGEDGGEREDLDSFSHKPFWKKSLVLSAGVLMNVFLAYLLISFGFMMGMPSVVESERLETKNVSQVIVQIAGVEENSPAARAGLKLGDYILTAGGKEIKNIEQLQEYIRNLPDEELLISYRRGKEEYGTAKVVPEVIENFGESKAIGVTLIQTGIVKYGFFESFYKGLIATFNLLMAIILAFYGLFKNLFSGAGLSADVAGPVGVAILTGRMVDLGFIYVLRFTAILSINLAVLNFLPFPALDGGRFIGALVEKVRRRPNNQQIENIIHNVGFSLLMVFVVFVTYRDVAKHSVGLIDKIKDFF